MQRRSWTEKRAEIMARPGVAEAYDAARFRFELGAAVREHRRARGLTQAQLAEAAGMKQPAIARFEAGGTMPTLPMLQRLSDALGLRLEVRLEPLDKAG
ncbi:hypothetical protein GCM10027168_07620 [Streptomyces capparidis]